jgi:hypothetical protein
MMFKRLLVFVFLSVFFVGLAAHVGIELYYSSNNPEISEPETGRVVQVTINHGKIVFVSQEELVRPHSIQTDGLLANARFVCWNWHSKVVRQRHVELASGVTLSSPRRWV